MLKCVGRIVRTGCTHTVRIHVLALLVCSSGELAAQRVIDNNAHLWWSHWGDHKVHDAWSIHSEGHLRRGSMGRIWQQLLLRPALNYHVSQQVSLTTGYSYYRNYPYGAYPVPSQTWEHNIFEQVQATSNVGRVRLQQRLRVEQRFLSIVLPTNHGQEVGTFDGYQYQDRLRYRLWLTLPIRGQVSAPGALTLELYDELFLEFGDEQELSSIDQNRISALVGYQVDRSLNLMLGYLQQARLRPGAARGMDLLEANSTIHAVLIYALDLRKSATELKP